MKKICFALLLILLLTLMIACQAPETTTSSTETTAAESTPALPEGERVVTDSYTAILNEETWESDGVDLSGYTLFGSGSTIYNDAGIKYSGYKRSWVIEENGEEKTVTYSTIKNMSMVGAEITLDETAKTAKIKLDPIEAKVQASWKEVSAKAGSYLMFEFTANVPMDFCVTVTAKEGGSQASAAYTQDGISTSGKDGKYTGIAKCTVPYSQGSTFYINICADSKNYPILASVPVHITAPKYDLPYRFIFQGDWDLIQDKSYIDNLYEVLYNSYPRAYQRWAFSGDEPLTLYVVADQNSEAIAYNAGTKVVVQVAYANSNPADVGLFAHEFTHAIQAGYGISYDNGWFTEAMADYGRFRFFHWGYSTDYIKDYPMNSKDIRDFRQNKNDPNSQWYGYAQHNLFMTYLDWKWPTVDKNQDGKVTPDEYGLLDHIVYSAKVWAKEGKAPVSDLPYTVGSTFNNWVKDITGIDTMELVRQQYVKELDEGTFVFTGFRDFVDNFLIENVYDIPNLIYPMKEKIEPSASSNPILSTPVTSGDNLCLEATIHALTTAGASKYVGENLIDGDVTTRYQATRNDGLYSLNGIQNEIVIDLGAVKTFDTYTLVGAGDQQKESFNMKSWEIFVSTDGTTFTAVDYQKVNEATTVSVTFGEQSARYVKIRLYAADQSGGGTARLYEFMLFDSQK